MQYLLLLLFQLSSLVNARGIFFRTAVWGRGVSTVKTAPRVLAEILSLRSGYQEGDDGEPEMSLDEKVQAAMKKLGLEQPSSDDGSGDANTSECKDGVCTMPSSSSSSSTVPDETRLTESQLMDKAAEIAESMQVDQSLAMAALGATAAPDGKNNQRTYSESAARSMIQQELDLISDIPEDCDEVKQLVSEGNDMFMSRRALAFAERDMDDARAILFADAEDEREYLAEEEARKQQEASDQPPPPPAPSKDAFKTVTVDSNFDPTQVGSGGASAPPSSTGAPKPAKKSDVVFEATTAQIQELVLESPVPVLLDVYADWCGPCKVLGPILEEMAVKSGGMFRLVKLNSDQEKPVASALSVTALPTVFGIRDGKILHMFRGMPKDEEMMKNFLMGLIMPGAKFSPPVTSAEQKTYDEMTAKLVKMAGAACFSFSSRERLQDRIASLLDKLVEETGDASRVEESALIIRSLLSNIIKNPYEQKFRKANLANNKIATNVAAFPSATAILKSVGYSMSSDGNSMTLGRNKKVINVAPLMVSRDTIDKWLDQSRYEIAKAARKRKDEEDKARLEAEGHFDKDEEEEEEVVKKEVDMDMCQLKVRMEGKKKVFEMSFSADDSLESILKELPNKPSEDEEIQVTCVAKRLVLKSSDEGTFQKSFRYLGLSPSAAVVVSFSSLKAKESSTSKLAERASQRKKKKGSHTMQSVGIYSKDDNAKGELIDGGGGTWYEHDVSDDEEEAKEEDRKEAESEEDEEGTEEEG